MRREADLEPGAIRAALERIDPAFTRSPQFVHETLSARLSVPVIVKIECVNPIRSFKGRGSSVAMQGLVSEGRIGPDRPVVCASAGNFGQGVAIVGRSLGVPSVVFASLRANAAKVARMRALGAEVIEVGQDFDTARAESETYAAAHDCHLLVDGDDPRISTGAATIALEVTDAVHAGALPAPSMAVVPVGNGSLIERDRGLDGYGLSDLRGRGCAIRRGARDDTQLACRSSHRHGDRGQRGRRHRDAGLYPARGGVDG